ncbi:hypothetical protein X801_07412 [Opisthorchis viverrini]|uniref:Uncharacterized protein n=1 Tax=Opisthorchis viverrini TaxID=6198 RepID=A0A1S8WQQ6_OPIVI|nr:hypothetical protein X801_07412 [Opisthorchis viverrini]
MVSFQMIIVELELHRQVQRNISTMLYFQLRPVRDFNHSLPDKVVRRGNLSSSLEEWVTSGIGRGFMQSRHRIPIKNHGCPRGTAFLSMRETCCNHFSYTSSTILTSGNTAPPKSKYHSPTLFCPASFVYFPPAPLSAPPHPSAANHAQLIYANQCMSYLHDSFAGQAPYTFMASSMLPPPGSFFLASVIQASFISHSPSVYYVPQFAPIPTNASLPNPEIQRQENRRTDFKGRIAEFFPVSANCENRQSQRAFRKRSQSGGEVFTTIQCRVGFLLNPSTSRMELNPGASDTILNERSITHQRQTLVQEKGFTLHAYNQFRALCLRDKEGKEKRLSQEINILYSFWSFFLR